MKRILIMLLLTACATSARADLVFRSRDVAVRLTGAACTSATLQALLAINGAVGESKVATVLRQGKLVKACWALDKDGDVQLADERGDSGYLPIDAFQPDVGV